MMSSGVVGFFNFPRLYPLADTVPSVQQTSCLGPFTQRLEKDQEAVSRTSGSAQICWDQPCSFQLRVLPGLLRF